MAELATRNACCLFGPYLIRDHTPLSWRCDDLSRVLEERYSLLKPIIIEGILLLSAMEAIKRKVDYLVFVDRSERRPNVDAVAAYLAQRNPEVLANYVLRWSSADYDRRVLQAHLAGQDRHGAN
jgi:hypothetical protein